MSQTEMTAKAIVRNRDGKYLVLRSSKWEERQDRSQKPDLPGGMVEMGESPQVAVAREVAEEAGISILVDEFVLLYSETEFYEDTDTSVVKHVFAATAPSDDVVLSWEHEAFEWVSEAEFLNTEWRPFYQRAHAYILGHKLLPSL
jgi:8-oxo-dGTP pyrophosphatase MutT (NUDIX family)